MKKTIDANDEVKKILVMASEISSQLKLRWILPESIMYGILYYYTNSDKETVKSTELYDTLNSNKTITEKIKSGTLSDLLFSESFIKKNKCITDFQDKDLTIFSPTASRIVDEFLSYSSLGLSGAYLFVLLYESVERLTYLISNEFGISLNTINTIKKSEQGKGLDKKVKVLRSIDPDGEVSNKYTVSTKEMSPSDIIKEIFEDLSKSAQMLGSGISSGNPIMPSSLGVSDSNIDDDDDKKSDKDSSSSPISSFSDILNSMGISGIYSFGTSSGGSDSSSKSGGKSSGNSKTPNLDEYSYDLTKAAKEGKLDPTYGRETEISQLSEILSCRKKNNAILLGDPGVGKTSIVEALAISIVKGNVPKSLIDKRICSLDLTSLVSGTKFRGEYEERLQNIIKEVLSNPNVIIYIDEFHNLIGSGSTDGKGDASNILKPYLSRGQFQCIGSTTVEEYRKYVEKDGALKRRFQNIMVKEPGEADTVKILETVQNHYETYHGVSYPHNILEKCVSWTSRYVTDRFFPDKAIDALDMIGSMTKLKEKTDVTKITELREKLNEYIELKNKAILDQDFEKAGEYRDLEIKGENELAEELNKAPQNKIEVTEDTLTSVIAKLSGIPVDTIAKTDLEKLRSMKKILESNIIGQDSAIGEVLKSLQRNSLGLRDTKKPISSFLMVGPTGSGKTYLCKTLAREFFGSDAALIKFDMSEFSEDHEITKLTGSTASYVGYEDAPMFDKIRRQPYSVVLFDEIEKAAPGIFPIFLSILDEGIVTLGNGQKVDFKNTIIIFTGNIGTKELINDSKKISLGFSKAKPSAEEEKEKREKIIQKAIEDTFSPEFINRLTKTILFNNLGKTELTEICKIEIERGIKSRLKESGYSLEVSEDVIDLIVSKCDTKYGARDLQRHIISEIEDKVCSVLLESDVTGTNIKAVKKDEKVEIEIS